MPMSCVCRHAARGVALVVVLVTVACHAAAAGTSAGGGSEAEWAAAAAACASDKYAPLLARIDNDLRHWKPPAADGISRELMDTTLNTRTITLPGQKAIGVLFESGKPFIISNASNLASVSHHGGLLTAHLMLFQALSRRFGVQIPDVEIVVSTFDVPEIRVDRPVNPKVSRRGAPPPVLRFCASQHHADIPVPDIHFQMRRFNASLLSHVPDINKRHPWSSKREQLFGRFTGYKRIIARNAPSLLKRAEEDVQGASGEGGQGSQGEAASSGSRGSSGSSASGDSGGGSSGKSGSGSSGGSGGSSGRVGVGERPRQYEGSSLCWVADQDLLFCDARLHFMEWAAKQRIEGKAIDVARQPRVDMHDHAGYKYLLHLDGQSCSSRLEQLLALGSLVFKEESGYHAFFHHLISPHQHYLPVWKETPKDTLQALEWAKANDDKAQGMAQAGQRFALQYLNPDALACYWFTLFTKLSQLLRYKPGRQHRQYVSAVPVEEFLAGPGRKWIRKAGLSRFELP